MSTEKARKHARDAELNAERAGMELVRMQKLCAPVLDSETLLAIEELLRHDGLIGPAEESESVACEK